MTENNDQYKLLDSGKRQEFSTGMVRDIEDEKKGDYSLISPLAIRRWAILMQKGANKYGKFNWIKGGPFSRFISSAKRHLDQYLAGERGENYEDHLAAVLYNVGALIHFEEMIKRGLLGQELNDLPNYIEKK